MMTMMMMKLKVMMVMMRILVMVFGVGFDHCEEDEEYGDDGVNNGDYGEE